MTRDRRPRCAVIRDETDLERLQADGTITPDDADALRDFAAFLRGEITASELDRRSARPCSSPARPNPAGRPQSRLVVRSSPPLGTTSDLESNDDHQETACSSNENGTTWNPGTTWLITPHTKLAWNAVRHLLNDGQWHDYRDVAQVMHKAADLAPRTIGNHLRSASRRGWIRQHHGHVKIRDRRALDEALGSRS